jgi:hypothetical protein
MIKAPYSKLVGVQNLVKRVLAVNCIKVTRREEILPAEVAFRKLFELQFPVLWAWATENKPHSLKLTKAEHRAFESHFGVSFGSALSSRRLYNAAGAKMILDCDNCELNRRWSSAMPLRIRKGVFVSRVSVMVARGSSSAGERKSADGDTGNDIYVLNGFVLSMRDNFTESQTNTTIMALEWDPGALPWSKFLTDVVGRSDPGRAKPCSIRGRAFTEWKSVGLPFPPDIQNNIVYASASALEAMSDRIRWLCGATSFTDPLGNHLIRERLRTRQIELWLQNPAVLATTELKSKIRLYSTTPPTAIISEPQAISEVPIHNSDSKRCRPNPPCSAETRLLVLKKLTEF